eukprot:5723877-Pleurochrysis_carterae.AAC.2
MQASKQMPSAAEVRDRIPKATVSWLHLGMQEWKQSECAACSHLKVDGDTRSRRHVPERLHDECSCKLKTGDN